MNYLEDIEITLQTSQIEKFSEAMKSIWSNLILIFQVGNLFSRFVVILGGNKLDRPMSAHRHYKLIFEILSLLGLRWDESLQL